MDPFDIIGQTFVHKSVPLEERLSLKFAANNNHLELLSTPSRCVRNFLHMHDEQYGILQALCVYTYHVSRLQVLL